MTLAEIKARPSTIDWTRVNATTDSDIDLQARKVAPTWIFRGGGAVPSPATLRQAMVA